MSDTTVETVVTFLEMRVRPHLKPVPEPKGRFALMRAVEPPVHFYRYLYEFIGRDYAWVRRLSWTDAEIAEIVHDAGVEIYVLYVAGVPAGIGELDFRDRSNVELVYFGLMPNYIGRGLGAFFLQRLIDLTWDRNPERFHMQTCTLDHPRALPLYQRNGFAPYAQTTEKLTIPESMAQNLT
jgi:GNAT superfamily N-acetyltransferase